MNRLDQSIGMIDLVTDSMDKSKVAYIQGRNDGKKESIETICKLTDEIASLKKLINCKHLRVSGIREENGFANTCLTCGHEWFRADKPLSEFEKFMKAGMLSEEGKKGTRSN